MTVKPENPYASAWVGFCTQTAEHRLVVLHEDGLYRHLRVQAPGTRMWSWDVATWPGHLATSGDIAEGYMFTRLPDMLDFFDRPVHLRNYYADGAPCIDVRYWAEKLCGGRSRDVKVYEPEIFLQQVREHLEEHIELGTEAQEEYDNIVAATRQVCAFHGLDFDMYIARIRSRGDSRFDLLEIDAENDVDDLQHLYYGLEIPEQSPADRREEILDEARWQADSESEAHKWLANNEEFVGSDTWEWDLREYDINFLFACYAIDTTVQLYRQHQRESDLTQEMTDA